MHLQLLPKELLSTVLGHLTWRDALRVAATCRYLHGLVLGQDSCAWLRSLHVPAAALPGRAAAAILLPRLYALQITTHGTDSGEAEGGGAGAAELLYTWLQGVVRHPPAEEDGRDPAAGAASPASSISPGTGFPAAAAAAAPPLVAPLLRTLTLQLDVSPECGCLLLRLCPNATHITATCMMADRHHRRRQLGKQCEGGAREQVQRQGGGSQQVQRQGGGSQGDASAELDMDEQEEEEEQHEEEEEEEEEEDEEQEDGEDEATVVTEEGGKEVEEGEDVDGVGAGMEQDDPRQQRRLVELFRRLSQLRSLSLSCPHCLDAFFSHVRSSALSVPHLECLAARLHPHAAVAAAEGGPLALPAATRDLVAAAASAAGASADSAVLLSTLVKARRLSTPSAAPAPTSESEAKAAGAVEAAGLAPHLLVVTPHTAADVSVSPATAPPCPRPSSPAVPLPPLAHPPPRPALLSLHSLELQGVRLSTALARRALPPLPHLRCLTLRDVSVSPPHPSGWSWLGDCTRLTRLALLVDCQLTPQRLGLAHPALSLLTALRELDAPAWSFPRDAPANLAPLTQLSLLVAASANSLPYVVPQALPSVRSFHCGCFFTGTPLGGHLAALLPALTELRTTMGWDAERGLDMRRQMAVAGGGGGGWASAARGGGGVPGRARWLGVGAGGALLLPGPAPGPTASSARSRVDTAVLPLDVHTCVRLKTYGSLRRLSLMGGPAEALLEMLSPLKGLNSLTLRWTSLPDGYNQDTGGADEADCCSREDSGGADEADCGYREAAAGASARPRVQQPLGRSANAEDARGLRGCGPGGSAVGKQHYGTCVGARGSCGASSGSETSSKSSSLGAVSWAEGLAQLIPALTDLALEQMDGLEGTRGHDVLEALVCRLQRLRSLKVEGMRGLRAERVGRLVAPRVPGGDRGPCEGAAGAQCGGSSGCVAGSCNVGVDTLVLEGCSGASEAECQAAVRAAAWSMWVELLWKP